MTKLLKRENAFVAIIEPKSKEEFALVEKLKSLNAPKPMQLSLDGFGAISEDEGGIFK